MNQTPRKVIVFQIKICGVTTVDDARAAADAGADAIGLNFYPRSPRALDVDRAATVAEALPAGVARVGVFVNASAEEISQVVIGVGLTHIQLHGDEPPELLSELAALPVSIIKAFRVGPDGGALVRGWLERASQLQVRPVACLIDANQPGAYGGTGQVADWPLFRTLAEIDRQLPMILAGGLTSDNVAEAIAAAHPAAVDTASGVESAPGHKDIVRMGSFILAARAAFGLLRPQR